jgi:hypothetical protein
MRQAGRNACPTNLTSDLAHSSTFDACSAVVPRLPNDGGSDIFLQAQSIVRLQITLFCSSAIRKSGRSKTMGLWYFYRNFNKICLPNFAVSDKT